MKLSVVIPVYKGEKTICELVEELIKNLTDYTLEIILVNDGSPDSSHEICLEMFSKRKGIIKYLKLAKNFGEHNAVMAGLNYSTGDYAVIIDDDFQNPPQEIRKLVETAQDKHADVVYSYYDSKKHSLLRNLGSRFNNLVASFLLDKPKDLYLSSFKCLSRFSINEIIKYRGPHPYIDGLILRGTRNIAKVLVIHDHRKEGKSGYTFRKLVRLWLNMFVNFSVLPLRLSTILGFVFSSLGGIAAIYLILERIFNPHIPVGFTSIIVAILVLSGIQMIMLGLIGEYIGKQFLIDNLTPQYVVRDIYSEKEA